MSVDLYEQYKDALRRGHIAIARGDLEAARDAYAAAIALAPDRASPHVGLAVVLLRQGAPADALSSFDAALSRSSRDAEALRGRAAALQALGRRTDAAETLDVLSEALEGAGRLGDACEATRRALDLAEQKARRRRFQELTRRLRLRPGYPVADGAGTPADPRNAAITAVLPGPAEPQAPGPESWSDDGGPSAGGADPEALAAPSETMAAPDLARQATEAPGPSAVPGPETPAAAEAELQVVPPPPDAVALLARAESALDAGDHDAAREAYLAAAASFGADGLVAAALDACYDVLAFAPDDPDVHLRLVDLYLAQDWTAAAADKLVLLGRLAELDNRPTRVRARIVGIAADHFPDDSRLRGLSATRADPR